MKAWTSSARPCAPQAEAVAAEDPLILASASPRRAELLSTLGIPFRVDPSRVEETVAPGESVSAAAVRLAEAKARDVASRSGESPVLAADTLVALGSRIFGKPGNDREADAMLRALAGRTHLVVTGIALHCSGRLCRAAVETEVDFAPMSETEIAWYIATGEPRDKAGGYAVQGHGARFISAVRGSYSNVVGLPVRAVYEMLLDAGRRDLALP
jgi:septum formation protein